MCEKYFREYNKRKFIKDWFLKSNSTKALYTKVKIRMGS